MSDALPALSSPPLGVNISNKLRLHYIFPCAGFLDWPDTHGYAECQYQAHDGSKNFQSLPSGDEDDAWRICMGWFGTHFAAVPTKLEPLPPSRVDIQIPDQTEWHPELWAPLGAGDSVHMHGTAINSLGISSYLAEGIRAWCKRRKDFESVYRSLPFGSTIRLRELKVNALELEFAVIENSNLANNVFLSHQDLCFMWGIDMSAMPPRIPYTQLQYENHLASDVILCRLPEHLGGTRIVFKSCRHWPFKIYHEIKTLLTMPPSKFILGRPEYLVTLPSLDNNQLVCGFLSHYYERGSLEKALNERRLAETLTSRQQYGWAMDITSALIHVLSSPAKFYSDLRLDQFVLAPNDDGTETAVLLDFEQSRNLYSWAPPEIYYLEWIGELGHHDWARSDKLGSEVMAKYGDLLERYLHSRKMSMDSLNLGALYDNPPLGWYWPWVSSTDEEREAGMVYMLGKALWCIFEGIGDVDIVLGRSGATDGGPRFPEFRSTPLPMQALIKRCTIGARVWTDGHNKIYRRGGRLFPLGKTGVHGEPEGTFEETIELIRASWQDEIAKAEQFVNARIQYRQGTISEAEMDLLSYLRRPRLEEVKAALLDFSKSGGAVD